MNEPITWIDYRPLDFQQQFHESTKPKVYLSAGYGAGKTYSLVVKMFALMNENHGLPGGMLCPTLKMFKRDVLPTIREICDENSITYTYHQTDHVFYFPHTGSHIYVFHGEDEGRSIRGPNLAFMLINELELMTKAVYDAAIARVRLKKANLRQVAMSSTPEGFNWAYEYFEENLREDTDLIYGDTAKNTFVADDYVKNLYESYDSELVDQYIKGKRVNLLGKRAARKFDRRIHCRPDIEHEFGREIWITIDFNVDPMSAVLWDYNGRPKQGPWLSAWDELAIPNSDTSELANAIKGKVNLNEDVVVLFPDPAGRARTTKSRGTTDITILKEAGFDDIRMKPRIQSVRDCLNALNNLFDKNRIEINAKRCKNFIADLEQCTLKANTWEIDKSNPKRTHWLDGAKNMADYEFPIRRAVKPWSIMR